MSSHETYPTSEPRPDLVREASDSYGGEDRASMFERLVAQGRLRPAKRDPRSLGVPDEAPHEIPISQALAELRSGT